MGLKKSKKKRKKRRSKFLSLLRFFFEIVFLIALAIVLFLSYKYARMTIEKPKRGSIRIVKDIPDTQKSKMEGFLTIPIFLVYGDNEAGIMEDIMIIASIEEEFGNVRFASLSTDLWLGDEEGYADVCSEIYEVDGPERLVTLLNRNLGLQMKDYIVLRTCILPETVDRFEGLNLSLAEGEAERANELLRVQGKALIEGAGTQHLNGTQVMAYCRSSYSNEEMMDKVSETAVRLLEYTERQDLSTVNHVTDELLYHVTTSITFFDFCRMIKDLLVYEIKPHANMTDDIIDYPQPLIDYLYQRTIVPQINS